MLMGVTQLIFREHALIDRTPFNCGIIKGHSAVAGELDIARKCGFPSIFKDAAKKTLASLECFLADWLEGQSIRQKKNQDPSHS